MVKDILNADRFFCHDDEILVILLLDLIADQTSSLTIANLLAVNGFDVAQIFYNLGLKLGLAHEKSVFPLFLNETNVDIYGNPVDLEGTIGGHNVDRFYKDWKLKSLEFKGHNPLIGIPIIEYRRLENSGPELFGPPEEYEPVKVVYRPREHQPKTWKELEEAVLIHGPNVAEPTSLREPLYAAILADTNNLSDEFPANHFLPYHLQLVQQGKRPPFFATISFLDGYMDARGRRRLPPDEVYELIGAGEYPNIDNSVYPTSPFRILERVHEKVPNIYIPVTLGFVATEDQFYSRELVNP